MRRAADTGRDETRADYMRCVYGGWRGACVGGWVGLPGSRACHRLPLIGQCSQCPGHSLWEEAGRRRRPSLAAGLQRARGPKLDSAL